jgi:DNA-directed RNA polymerase subunit beta'
MNITKKIRNYKKKLKVLNYFIQTKIQPHWMTIKYLPVLPPNIRPIIKLTDNTIFTSDLNFIYIDIINNNNKINKLRKMLIPETFLHFEKKLLQGKIDKLIMNETKNNLRLII